MRSILADTGPLVAYFLKRDPHHRDTVRWMTHNAHQLLSTWPVIVEACHFLDLRGKLALFESFSRGALSISDIAAGDLKSFANVMSTYSDREVDLADASLVILAERTGVTEIITIDRSDFSTFRLSRGKAFTILFP